jgi:hypothetical protein
MRVLRGQVAGVILGRPMGSAFRRAGHQRRRRDTPEVRSDVRLGYPQRIPSLTVVHPLCQRKGSWPSAMFPAGSGTRRVCQRKPRQMAVLPRLPALSPVARSIAASPAPGRLKKGGSRFSEGWGGPPQHGTVVLVLRPSVATVTAGGPPRTAGAESGDAPQGVSGRRARGPHAPCVCSKSSLGRGLLRQPFHQYPEPDEHGAHHHRSLGQRLSRPSLAVALLPNLGSALLRQIWQSCLPEKCGSFGSAW